MSVQVICDTCDRSHQAAKTWQDLRNTMASLYGRYSLSIDPPPDEHLVSHPDPAWWAIESQDVCDECMALFVEWARIQRGEVKS